MRVLSVTAQKPCSTGSGVYLTEVVRSLAKMGVSQAVVAGVTREDRVDMPEGVTVYPVYFSSEKLPYPVVGMSDEMPYTSTRYRDMTEEMAGQFGVSDIYVTDMLKNVEGLHVICMLPDGYWYKEKKSISVSWPKYEENRINFMKERNVGGKIHDLLSSAVLVDGATPLVEVEVEG